MGRPKKTKGEAPTRERILSAAEELFGQQGYRKTSLADIANAVGLKAPSVLLHHFKSKEDLFEQVIRNVHGRVLDIVMKSIRPGESAKLQFQRMVGAFADFVEQNENIVVQAVIELLANGTGSSTLGEVGTATLGIVEQFVRQSLDPPIPPEAPVRDAILQVTTSYIIRKAVKDRLPGFWSDQDHSRELAAGLFQALRDWPNDPGQVNSLELIRRDL